MAVPRSVKGLLLPLLALMAVGQLRGQDVLPAERNELKLNGLFTLLGAPEVTYERLLSTETSYGVSLAVGADPDIDFGAGLTPYFRWYFSKKPAAGLFIESVGSVFVRRDFFQGSPGDDIAAGVGFSLGYKLVSDGGWVGEVYAGAGRNFVNTYIAGEVFPRIGFCIGRRFGS